LQHKRIANCDRLAALSGICRRHRRPFLLGNHDGDPLFGTNRSVIPN
jgi:hypothetical protein